LGVFDLFKERYTTKDDAVYVELVKKVLVEERISRTVVVDAGTPVSALVGLFEGTMQDAKQWKFGHKRSLDIFSATVGRSRLFDTICDSVLAVFIVLALFACT